MATPKCFVINRAIQSNSDRTALLITRGRLRKASAHDEWARVVTARLVISVHDVAAASATPTEVWLEALDRRGLPSSLLVIPGPWHGDALAKRPSFHGFLRTRQRAGDEIVQHGWRHGAGADACGWRAVAARTVARGAGEFAALSGPAALMRLCAGRAVLAAAGLATAALTAPGRLHSPGTLNALRQLGFTHTTTHTAVIDLVGRRTVPGFAFSHRPGSVGERGAAHMLRVGVRAAARPAGWCASPCIRTTSAVRAWPQRRWPRSTRRSTSAPKPSLTANCSRPQPSGEDRATRELPLADVRGTAGSGRHVARRVSRSGLRLHAHRPGRPDEIEGTVRRVRAPRLPNRSGYRVILRRRAVLSLLRTRPHAVEVHDKLLQHAVWAWSRARRVPGAGRSPLARAAHRSLPMLLPSRPTRQCDRPPPPWPGARRRSATRSSPARGSPRQSSGQVRGAGRPARRRPRRVPPARRASRQRAAAAGRDRALRRKRPIARSRRFARCGRPASRRR